MDNCLPFCETYFLFVESRIEYKCTNKVISGFIDLKILVNRLKFDYSVQGTIDKCEM